jgi:transcription elongation GreA/GreB family factor
MVITPASALGRELLSKSSGDSVEIMTGITSTEYELVIVQ